MTSLSTSTPATYVDPMLVKIAQDENFTLDNRIINAWEAGISKGRTEAEEVLYDAFKNNLSYCLKKADELFKFLKESGKEVNYLFLKSNGLKTFEGLMVIDKGIYLNKDFRKEVYTRIFEIKKAAFSELKLHFEIALMPNSEDINLSAINSEDFVFQHKLYS